MHKPVLLKEVIKALEPKPGETVLDATIDGGGHAMAVIEKILPKGKLIGIEQDGGLLEKLKFEIRNSKFETADNFILINGNFRDLDKFLEKRKIKSINKALFDLGISSWHLEESGRGFSFRKNEILDMRFNPVEQRLKAEEILNKANEKELREILKKYGEERFAVSIAGKIVEARKEKPIKTTFELVEVISRAVPNWYKKRRIHFATKTFQALRIAVNDELESLEQGINKCWRFLKPGGRMAIISFHSLEDRIIKIFFREKALANEGKILTKKPVIPSPEELKTNLRARSAKLRAAEKI